MFLVFNHKRLSEQLRIEKEVFPECIQAPAKYENKRKSSLISHKNKENSNRTFFPGEDTLLSSENITMENSVRYVQQWLKKNDSDFARKPFRDLNVNTQLDHNTKIPKTNYKLLTNNIDQNGSVLKTNRKRSHYKTTVKNNLPQSGSMKSIKKQHYGSPKKVKKELHLPDACIVRSKTKAKCDNDESGIFMDDDPIVIDDSQETIIDKDRNAWLAVLKANENEEIESTSLVNLDSNDHKTYKETPMQSDGLQSQTYPNIKVPFYKKSNIIETCTYCNVAADKAVRQPKKVEITIDNANFTATIKILKDVENRSKLNTTNSVSVQTDICETIPIDNIGLPKLNDKDGNKDVVSLKSDTQSEDLFEEEDQPNIGIECKQNILHDCLVIVESDSDMELEGSGPLPVKVDVHRSCDES